MIDYTTCTQDDIDDSTFTEFNEGFVAYMFGHFCHENPYSSLDNDNDEEVKRYVMWFDGWMSARERYPDLEPAREIAKG